MEGNEKMNKFRVGPLPTLYYIPDFITDSEQIQLLNNVAIFFVPHDGDIFLVLFALMLDLFLLVSYSIDFGYVLQIYQAPISKWKSLKNRRLQNWGGVVHEKGLLSQDLPPWLTKITQRIFEESGLFPSAINHVLINEYLPKQGIMPHQDGPAYFPVVAILSLGSPAFMDFTPHSRLKLYTNSLSFDVEDNISDGGTFGNDTDKWLDNHHPFSVLLMPCSLLIFKDKAYSDYLHGIKDIEVQQYDGAVNVEALEHHKLAQPLSGSENAVEVMNTGYLKSIHRTTNRISLTCRLVLKVHKNLFKF